MSSLLAAAHRRNSSRTDPLAELDWFARFETLDNNGNPIGAYSNTGATTPATNGDLVAALKDELSPGGVVITQSDSSLRPSYSTDNGFPEIVSPGAKAIGGAITATQPITIFAIVQWDSVPASFQTFYDGGSLNVFLMRADNGPVMEIYTGGALTMTPSIVAGQYYLATVWLDSANAAMFFSGVPVSSSSSMGTNGFTDFAMFSADIAGSHPMIGRMRALGFAQGRVNVADRQVCETYLSNKYAGIGLSTYVDTGSQPIGRGFTNVHFTGNSFIADTYVSLADRVPQQTLLTLGVASYAGYYNIAQNGQYTSQMIPSIPSQVTPFFEPAAVRNVLFFFEGINEINVNVKTGVQAEAIGRTYVADCQGQGFLVGSATIPPCGINDTERLAFNAAMLANSASYDFVLDWASNTIIVNNITEMSGSHPNTTAMSEMGLTIANAILAL